MKARAMIAGALILVFLSGCGIQGQSSAEACKILNSSLSELSPATQRLTENIADPIIRELELENILRILDEQEENLQPRDPDLAEAIQTGIDAQRTVFSSMQGIDPKDWDFSPVETERYAAANGRFARICTEALSSE